MRKFVLAFLPKVALLPGRLSVLSRPVQIMGGLLLGAHSVLTMGCAVVMFSWPDPDHALTIALLHLVIEVGAIWTFIKAADLVFGRRTQGGLIGATGLRIIAAAYAVMMVVVSAFGGFRHPSYGRLLVAVGAAIVVVRLLLIVRKRQTVKATHAAPQLKA